MTQSGCDVKSYHNSYGCMGYIPNKKSRPFTTRDGYMEFATEEEYKEYKKCHEERE